MKPVSPSVDILTLHAEAPKVKSQMLIRDPKRIPIEDQSSRNNHKQQKSHNAQRKLHSPVFSALQL
jgi:hypothetical protein